MIPLPFVLATQAIYDLYVGSHPALLPDAKAQVTYDYRKRRIDTFLISTQHKEDVDPQDVCTTSASGLWTVWLKAII